MRRRCCAEEEAAASPAAAADALLVQDAWTWEIYNLVFHCPSCGAHNEVEKPATEGR